MKCFHHPYNKATHKRVSVLKNSNHWIYLCSECASFLQKEGISKELKLQKI